MKEKSPDVANAWTVFESGNQWHVRFKMGGKWKQHRIAREVARSHSEAVAYAQKWFPMFVEEMQRDNETAQDPVVVTIRSLVPRWLAYLENAVTRSELAEATRILHATALKTHVLNHELADIPIEKINTPILRAWIRHLMETTSGSTNKLLSGSRVRNITSALSAFFADAMAEGWCDLPASPMLNPAVRRQIPTGTPLWGKHCQPHLTRAQIERLVTCSQVPEWRRVHHLFAATSGLAQGELFGLDWRDLNLETGIVRVNKALALTSKTGRVGLQNPKTDNRVRDLPLHPLALKALKAWKARGFAELAGRAPLDSDPVFPSPRHNERGEIVHWRPKMNEFLREDLRAAGESDLYEGWPLTAHALRRSFATWLLEADVPDPLRKRLMGHASANVTDSAYSAKSIPKLREAVEKIRLDLSVGDVVPFPVRPAVGVLNDETTDSSG